MQEGLWDSLSSLAIIKDDSQAALDASELIEPRQSWHQTPPEFVLDLSEETVEWAMPTYDYGRHSTFISKRQGVLLFGPSHLVDVHGRWTCESLTWAHAYLDFYNKPMYDAIFPGKKPKLLYNGDHTAQISFQGISAEDVIHLESAFLVTPQEPLNWGRWLCSVIPKLHYFKANYEGIIPLLCTCPKHWQLKMFDFMGIDRSMVHAHDPGRTYVVKGLTTIVNDKTDCVPSASEVLLYRDIADKCEHPAEAGSLIYISRKKISVGTPNYRVLQNEDELIDALTRLGFLSINPEEFPIEAQIGIFSKARMIVGLGGSGLYNVLFCNPEAKVVTIESTAMFVSTHTRLFSALGVSYGVIFGKVDDGDANSEHKRWTIDVARAVQAVAGFM